MEKIKQIKYKSYKFILRIKLILRKMNRRLKYSIFAFFLISIFLIPFQNCGQKMESATDLTEVLTSSQDPQSSGIISGRCSAILNTCVAGSFLDEADSATQNKWSCQGSNGGSTISCATNKPPAAVNGVCSSVLNQCTSGSFLDEADTDLENKWSCEGADGGTTMLCSLTKPPTAPPPLPIVQAPSGTTPYDFAHDLEYQGVNGPIKFDFYHPKDYLSKQNLPVFIWVHGGGWTGGDKSEQFDRALAVKLAERGFIVLNVNYTLAPGAPVQYPTPYIAPVPYIIGVQDINKAIELVKANASNFHMDLQKISIGGGSAGGHLALMTAASRSTIFNCVISAAGPTDLLLGTQMTQFPLTIWIVKSVYGNTESVLKANSPLYQANNIQARRVYLLHQEKDNLVPIQHAQNFLTAARPRFQSALETTFLNDPLPAGTPYENPSPAQVTHNFNESTAINAVSNFLVNKCY